MLARNNRGSRRRRAQQPPRCPFLLNSLKGCRYFREEMTMDRLVAMETFVRVIEAGSFSGAAKQLRVGQPAVSKTVAQLEDRLGVRLLLRSTHGLTPTEAGRSFYERAKRSIEEADEADLAARGAAATLFGRLRICAAVTFARLHVVPRLPSFLATHPSLDVDIVMYDGDLDLVASGIDVALRMSPLRELTLPARKIAVCRRRVIAAPEYLAVYGTPESPSGLAQHQAIVYEQRLGGPTWVFRKDEAESSVTMKGRVHVSAAEGVREGVLAGMGYAIASEWMFTEELRSGSVLSVLDDWVLPDIELFVIFPPGRQASAKARAFANFIARELANGEVL
jgi:DNA-binding transcriptional LysR family regulator